MKLHDRGYTIRIRDTDGGLMSAIGAYGALPTSSASLASALDGKSTFETVIEPSTQEPVRFYSGPILAHDGVIGVMQVAQSLDNMNDTLEQLTAVLLVSIPLLVLLAAIVGYLLAARALAPIDMMTRTAQRISAHDLHERLNLPPSDDEIGRLSATFDGMLARLEAAFTREQQFSADASHELRTPLAAMQTMIAVTRQRRRSPEVYEQTLDDFNTEIARLVSLVDNLLLTAPRARRLEHGVAHKLRGKAVGEVGHALLAGLQAIQKIRDLVDEGVLVADGAAGHPPVLHVGVVAIPHADCAEAAHKRIIAVLVELELVRVSPDRSRCWPFPR